MASSIKLRDASSSSDRPNLSLENSAQRIAYVDHFMEPPDDVARLRSLKSDALRASRGSTSTAGPRRHA
mgnify:CR=1 FL=1